MHEYDLISITPSTIHSSSLLTIHPWSWILKLRGHWDSCPYSLTLDTRQWPYYFCNIHLNVSQITPQRDCIVTDILDVSSTLYCKLQVSHQSFMRRRAYRITIKRDLDRVDHFKYSEYVVRNTHIRARTRFYFLFILQLRFSRFYLIFCRIKNWKTEIIEIIHREFSPLFNTISSLKLQNVEYNRFHTLIRIY